MHKIFNNSLDEYPFSLYVAKRFDEVLDVKTDINDFIFEGDDIEIAEYTLKGIKKIFVDGSVGSYIHQVDNLI